MVEQDYKERCLKKNPAMRTPVIGDPVLQSARDTPVRLSLAVVISLCEALEQARAKDVEEITSGGLSVAPMTWFCFKPENSIGPGELNYKVFWVIIPNLIENSTSSEKSYYAVCFS